MTGFVNDPGLMRQESLAGFALAHAGLVILDPGGRFVRRRVAKRARVAIVAGGGSGHEPLHIGFVGTGMLDAAVPGRIFTAPPPDQIVAAIQAVEAGRGVVMIVKNYDGDVMNCAMAAESVGSPIASVLVDDDVSTERATGRRGVAGTLVVEKIVGAAAERGDDLADVAALGARVAGRTRSIGVALRPCTVPTTGQPNFVLGPDEMEMGVGLHGEAGRNRLPRSSADVIAAHLVAAVLAELRPAEGEEALMLVNGFGGTPLAELHLMVHCIGTALERAGVRATRVLAGSFATSLDMAGCSLTLAMLDAPLQALWDAPVRTPTLTW